MSLEFNWYKVSSETKAKQFQKIQIDIRIDIKIVCLLYDIESVTLSLMKKITSALFNIVELIVLQNVLKNVLKNYY